MILVSGKTKEFPFNPTASAAEITQHVYDHWPEGKECLTDVTDWMTDWLADWLTDGLADWLTDQCEVWLADWLIDWLTDGLTDWPTDALIIW